MGVWLHAWVPACVSGCLSACVHGCLHACVFSHVPVFDYSLPGILQTGIPISFSRVSA